MNDVNEKSAGANAVAWKHEAKCIVQALLSRHDCTYKELSRRFEQQLGIHVGAKALSNHVNRGTFSFSFVLQIAKALDVSTLDVRGTKTPGQLPR